MSNYPAGTAANVLVGPARILIAPYGSALPVLDGTQNPIVWPGAWKEVGYTAKGTTLSYAPTIKDITVDEETAPVGKVLDAEKVDVSVELAEATLNNLANAISAMSLTQTAADGTHAQLAVIKVGGGTVAYVAVGFEGVNQAGFQRIFIGFKTVANGQIKATFERVTEVNFAGQFALIADTTQPRGSRLFSITDILAPHI